MTINWLINTKENNRQKYIFLSSSNGKKWLIPTSNIKMGMCLYQPSSWKGKVVKKVVLAGRFFPLLLSELFQIKKYDIEENLKNDIYRALEVRDDKKLTFSIFLGTPGVHQKTVIQVSLDDKILGYCKLTNDSRIGNLFKSEICILEELYNRGIYNIPHPLLLKTDKYFLYIQSSEKSYQSREVGNLELAHIHFLGNLYNKTKKLVKYENSNFYKNIHMEKSEKQFRKLRCSNRRELFSAYKSALEKIDSKFSNQELYMGIAHRDFTPWNMFKNTKSLFVFDWEYASAEYLPMVDLFHFVFQDLLFGQGKTKKQIQEHFKKKQGRYAEYLKLYTSIDYEYLFTAYLLDVISQYLIRTDKEIDEEESRVIDIRIQILKSVIS